jgi:hypothetical protein
MSGASGKATRAAAALLAVLLFLLTSCAQIPRSGPVGKSKDESAGNPNNAPVFFPTAPRAGASPEAVIEDFYLAGSGYEDDYAVARQYLTQASSVTWKPDQRVLVFRSARVVPTGVENVFNYELDLAYSVDADGVVAGDEAPGNAAHVGAQVHAGHGDAAVEDTPVDVLEVEAQRRQHLVHGASEMIRDRQVVE